jgi:hypothetical protein
MKALKTVAMISAFAAVLATPLSAFAAHKVCHFDHHHHRVCHWVR